MNALISVIIPIYKVEDYLDECISSVVNQTYNNLEIILVDDGSPDQCPKMCDEWALKDSRIRVIHKPNGGLSDARNAGLDIAKGEYIAFVDSDDWIAPDMFEKMLGALQRENADICACGIMVAYPERQQPMRVQPMVGDSEKILSMIYNDTAYPVAAWNKLYKRIFWEEFRFPKGKICEDTFTTYLLVDRADTIVQISEPLYYYRIRENSIMTSTFSKKRMDEEEAWRFNYQFIEQNYPSLKNAAYDFYLQKVNILIYEISKENKDVFAEEYAYLYGILKKNVCYIMFKSRLSLKKRVKMFLDIIQL